MKKTTTLIQLILIFYLSTFNVKAQDKLEIAIGKAFNYTDCNYGIMSINLWVNNPGNAYSGPYEWYTDWSISAFLDDKLIYSKKIGPRNFTLLPDGRYIFYDDYIPVDKALDGKILHGYVQRIDRDHNTDLTWEPIYSEPVPWCNNLDTDPPGNNGDDPTNTYADLYLDKTQTIIFSDDVTIPPVLSQIGSKRYLIRYETGSIRIAASIIQNKGEANSSPTNITYYLSTDTSLNYSPNSSNNYDTKINITTSLPSISANGFKEINDIIIDGYDLYANNKEPTTGNYYILAVLDFGNKVNEGDKENNNITAIPIKYERIPKKSPPKKPCPPYCLQDPLPQQVPYQVNVYNFSGMKVNSATVKNNEEEKELINSLPSGTQYIIKTKNEDKKISK